MTDPHLAALDLSSYARMVRVLLPATGVLAVCDAAGVPVWAEDTLADGEIEVCMRVPEAGRPTGLNGGSKTRSHRLPDHRRLLVTTLLTSTEVTVGHLLLILQRDEAGFDEAAEPMVVEALQAVAEHITKDYELQAELDAMADELGERYEELHLVYETNDQVDHHGEAEQALADLLKNCRTFLNIPFAELVVPEIQIDLIDQDESVAVDLTTPTCTDLRDRLIRRMRKHRQGIVLNNPHESIQLQGGDPLPYKVLAAPLLDGQATTSGGLIILKPIDSADFTNSDRNILQVVAKKASKIIQAAYDLDTGLTTHAGLEYHLQEAIVSMRDDPTSHCLLHIAIDHIRVISDTKGAAAAKEILAGIGQLLRHRVRNTDFVARLGEAEFGIFLKSCGANRGIRIAHNLREAIEAMEFATGDEKLNVSASVGVAEVNAESADTETLFARAQVACDSAGERGREGVRRYDPTDPDLQRREGEMAYLSVVRRALREDHFELWAQPILPLSGEGESHFEILLRMRDGEKIVPPGVFMPAAERYRLMPAIDRWVIHHAFAFIADHRTTLLAHGCVIAINLSGQSFGDPSLVGFIKDHLRKSDFPAEQICFEITESAAMGDIADARELITTLAPLGFRFSLDDFGSGLSSFSYLKNLAVDYLKIDGEFVRGMVEDPISAVMVEAINRVAQVMKIPTIAEFVENDAIRDALVRLGVDFGQGYGLGKPTPFADLLASWEGEDVAHGRLDLPGHNTATPTTPGTTHGGA